MSALEILQDTQDELANLDQIAYAARYEWLSKAKKHQVPPPMEQDYLVWALIAGRGAGKSRSGAEQLWWWAWTYPKSRCLIIAPTANDCRLTCLEGESGVLAVCPEFLIEDYNKTDMIIYLKNGSQIRAVSAENPERLRGLNTSWVWVDELAAIQRDEDCWNMMMFGLRLGKSPRIIVTTTPKPRDLLIKIIETPTTVVDRASTYANIDNLSPTFREQILQYEQTKLGRQEIHAEILDAEEGGVVKREWIKLWPNYKPFPEELQFVITSYDCAYGEKQTNDYTACTTWGIFKPLDGPLAVLLLDCWQERLSFPDLKPRVLEEWETSYGSGKKQKRCDLIVIEEKAAGISLLQELRRMHLPVVGWNPGRADKLQRLHIAATVIAAGRVWMPESGNRKGFVRDWAEPLVSQMCSFPQCSHDDLMDAAVQALRYLKDTGWLEINRPPKEEDWDDIYDVIQRKGNPYAQ